MDEETTSKTSTELERWDYLFQEQSTIFRNTVTRNKVLEGEVEELRRELSVWKAAQKTADESAKLAERTISKLQRSLDAMKDDNPLVVCLIDGDGTIFSQDLWGLGQIGGRQAAMLLTKGITDHVVSSDEAVSNRCRIWLSIFCNKAGLMDVLQRNGVCNTTQFEEFFQGFNQASPLFSIIDVGNGKEAADSKIKEYLRVFTRFPQTSRVYFGGAHDNGYSSTLTFLENEGLLDKVVLLRGYKNLAFELQNIDLSHLEIEGLFMTQKLQATHSWKHITLTPPAHPVQLQDFEKFKTKSRATSDERKPTGKTLDPNQPLNKRWHLRNLRPAHSSTFRNVDRDRSAVTAMIINSHPKT
ncbi:hypothetical protein BV25DRAFT_1911578 [Artomyces pyxidatus]|uniref:Uncharacterized protein n=1 Tax=Artomyces pyxidatus TaxID=48021 RepID=A0ACB8TGX9_9AGAM|nr:hypothetical protein BV25DRAFT_1911578 [Artomyces pyxidatus]